jgi:alkaline phosphatase
VLSFLLSVVLKIIDFKQHMGFKGSFNRNYLRMKEHLICVIALFFAITATAQENYKEVSKADSVKTYIGTNFYEVKNFTQDFGTQKPRNVILMIGDGMGFSHIFAGITANRGHLFLENFKYTGYAKTQSSDNYITDSAAGGTALASGHKTYNKAIGVNADSIPVKTILEMAEEKGLSTGLVSTSAITHATPASFISHQAKRTFYEDIAADFLQTDVDVFIGGGYKHFTDRKDGRNLVSDLQKKGYTVLQDINEIAKVRSGKLAGLTALEHNPRIAERKDMLPIASGTAIDILDNNKKGFFLMIEGSQIDWGGHQNNTIYLVEEMLDFDRTIGKVLEFASKNKETLIVITADHETGGFSINGGNNDKGIVKGAFTTGGHTASMVPVFAYGPGAGNFTGIMDNTDIPQKIKKLLGL